MLGAGSTTGFGSTWADRGPRYYPYGNPADEEFYFWSPQGQRLGTYKSSAPGAANSAVFLKTDTTTQGTWKGVYGADGYNVIDDTTAYPSYATVTPASQFNYVWSASTSDVRGLQKAASATDRIAATWYSSGTYTIDVNFSDTAQHQVAVYCVDWDYLGRTQTISVLDGATQAVLDSHNIANFANGQYLVWTLSGHVILRITNSGPQNAVISGLFFDTSPGSTAFTTASTNIYFGSRLIQAQGVTVLMDRLGSNVTGGRRFFLMDRRETRQPTTSRSSPDISGMRRRGSITRIRGTTRLDSGGSRRRTRTIRAGGRRIPRVGTAIRMLEGTP